MLCGLYHLGVSVERPGSGYCFAQQAAAPEVKLLHAMRTLGVEPANQPNGTRVRQPRRAYLRTAAQVCTRLPE